MHEDFDVVLSEMKQQLQERDRRSSSKLTSSTANTRNNPQLASVQPPSNNVRKYEELSEAQQRYYDAVLKQRQERILRNRKSVIEQYLEYRKPFLVDAFLLNTKKYQGRCPNLFVLPVFMPAGKHTYLVKNMDTYEYSMHNALADFRSEDPPVLLKDLKQKVSERKPFRKETSVFEPWKEDDDLLMEMAANHDFGNSKITKMIKD